MIFQNTIDSGTIDGSLDGNKTGSTTISGATGSICTKSGVYRCTDTKAQYLEVIVQNDAFPPFPGGKGTKDTTWTLMTTSTSGTAVTSDDGEFKSVMVE